MVVVAIISVLGLFSPTVTQAPAGIVGAVNPYSTNFTALGIGINDKFMVTSAQRVSMTAIALGASAAAVPCSFLTPNATTTLSEVSVLMTSTSVATTTTWELASASSAIATTTLIASIGNALTASQGFGWSYGTANTIFSPNTYVNVGVQASTSAQIANIAGTCQLELYTL